MNGFFDYATIKHLDAWLTSLNILFRTSEYRGDHSADVAYAVEPIAGETIEQLVERLEPKMGNVIEVRIMTAISIT